MGQGSSKSAIKVDNQCVTWVSSVPTPVLGAAGPNIGDSAWARFGGCPAGDHGWGRKPTGSPRQGQWVPRELALAEVGAVWEDRTAGWGKPSPQGSC